MGHKYDKMVQYRKEIKTGNEEKAIQAINSLVKRNEKVTFQKIANMTGINRSTLYRNERIRKIIEQYVEHPRLFRGADSNAALLKLEEKKNKQLKAKCDKLEKHINSQIAYREQYFELKAELKELKDHLAEADGSNW